MDPVSATAAAASAVPQIINTIQRVKKLYDAFCNEYTSSAALLKVLIDDIKQFQLFIVQHKTEIEERGLQYQRFESVIDTLEQCIKFQNDYRVLLDNRRKRSFTGAFKTIRFTWEEDEIKRLRERIREHRSDMVLSSVHIIMVENRQRDDRLRIPESSPISIPRKHEYSVESCPSPPSSMEELGSPVFKPDQSLRIRPPLPAEGISNTRPPMPTTPPARQTTVENPSSIVTSPTLLPLESPASAPPSLQGEFTLPGLILPQPALSYVVAEVFFGTKKVSLRRKPAGQDSEVGRELIIRDQDSNLRFRHRIRRPSGEACYPYTWHSKWKSRHMDLEISFTGTAPDAHSISFKGAPATIAMPTYIFTEHQDFRDFQSEVRGKKLEDTFEVRLISSANAAKNGEATDQHLKMWRDNLSQECSISFYASAAPKPRHLEFPLNAFDQGLRTDGRLDLRLNFIAGTEPKRARTFSRPLSRPSTDRSISTATASNVFTRHNTGIASSESSVTTMNSRMSVASMLSDGSQAQGRLDTRISLESQVKKMKYLDIEFSNEGEAARFKKAFETLYREEISRPQDFFHNWRMNSSHQRAGSVTSVSPSATPFSISPDLRPRSSVPREEGG